MEKELHTELEYIKKDIQLLHKKVDKLNQKLFENGLVLEVHDNTQFRKGFNKWLVAIWGAILGLASRIIYSAFSDSH